MKDECTAPFSNFSHNTAGPKHRGDAAELLLMSITTCYTGSIENQEI